MELTPTQLEERLDRFLHQRGYELVALEVVHMRGGTLFRLFIDRLDEERVTIGDCTKLSPPLRLELEALGVYDEKSSLEVSSPGIERVLTKTHHFERFVGHRVRVTLLDDGLRKTIVGVLQGADEEQIWLGLDARTSAQLKSISLPDPQIEPGALRQVSIPRDQVLRCQLVAEW